jgi:hypothetical protein
MFGLSGVFHTASGQTDSYTLKGTAKAKEGNTYQYQFTFSVHGSSLKGYSITRQVDGSEFKAKIKGHLNKKKHTLSFKETEPFDGMPKGASADSITTCLFEVALAYKLHGSKYEVKGIFTGKNNLGLFCEAGMMEFSTPDSPTSVFHEETVNKKPAATESQAKAEAGTELKITEGEDKVIAWHSDNCLLEVWDGGVVDGDKITVKLNDKVILDHYSLIKERKQIRLPIAAGTNTIAIIADDEGDAPPNTAQILLTDGHDEYKITAYNKAGKVARIVITR